MTQGNDTLIVDVVARLDERSFRQIQQDAERAGQRSGAGFGGGLVEGAEQGAQDAARAVQDGMQDAERAAEDGGGKAGGKLAGAFQGALAALPAMAAAAAVAVGAAAVAGVVAVTNMAAESAQNVNEFQAQLGATREEAERLGGIAEQVFGDNWTGSLTEAAAAVTTVRREVKGLAESELRSVTGAVVGIAETFGEEQGRVAAAVSSLMTATGMSAQEATDFIARGFQKGLNSSGDFLDTLTEYGPQFEKAKIGGGELFSLLETGAAKGALGTDKVADAFKEFGLTIVDVSEDSAGVYKELGLNQEKLVKGINDGSITQAQAFELVTNKLAEVKGQADRTRIGAAIFGGAGEDFANGLTQLDLTKTSMKDLAGGVDAVNTRYNSFRDVFQGVWRQVQVALLPVGKELLGIANEAMPAVKEALAQVTPVVTQVVRFLIDGFRQGHAAGQQFADQFGPQIERALVTFRPVLQAIGPLFASVFGLVKTLWETVLRPVLTAIAPLIAGTVATIGNTLNLVVRIVTGVVNAVSALFRGDLSGAVKALEGIFEAGVTFVVRQVRNMASTILGLIKNLAPQMADAAADILRGLIRGIESGAGNVVAAARNMAGGIIDGIRSKLKIQSPSKEMYILGEHTADGLTSGITAKTPAVQKAAKDMATGVITEAQKARAELEKSIKMDAWVDSLQNATTAQLKAAQATARAAGEADKYNAIKAELERREQAATAATEKATQAAKAQAEQLAANRKAITDGLKFEAYVAGLSALTDAQLAAQASAARSAGDQQRFNAVLSEQRSRADEAAKAVSDLADAQIAAANSAAQRDPQGFTDAAYRQSFGAGDVGLIRSLAAVTGLSVTAIRADVQGALDDAKRFAPAAAATIERVWAAALEARRTAAAEETQLNAALNASYEQQSAERIALIKKRSEEAERATPDFEGMQRELEDLGRPLDGLVQLATEYADGADAAAEAARNWLAAAEQASSIDQNLIEFGGLSIDPETGEAIYQTEEQLRGIGVAADDAGEDFIDLQGIIENVLTMPWDELGALLTASGLDASQVEKITVAWRDFRLEMTQIAGQDELLGPVAEEFQRVYDALNAGTLQGADALAALDTVRAKLAGIGGEAAQNLIKAVDELTAGVQKGIDAADRLHDAWVDNLNRIGFQAYVDGLRDMSDAQLQLALDTALLNENTAEFNALLAEQTKRLKERADAEAKAAALELNGTNVSGRFEKGKTEASDKLSGTVLNTVEAIGALANPATYLAFILEKLNIVGTIFEGILSVIAAPLAALQEPLRLLGELIGALMVPNLQLLAAVLTPVVRVLVAFYDAVAELLKRVTFGYVDITRDKYKQGSAALAPAPAAPSTTAPATASGNNVVQIPSSQVTVIASPSWVPKMEAAADKMLTAGEYMAVLAREGIRIRTDTPAPTPAASGPGLAWDLRT